VTNQSDDPRADTEQALNDLRTALEARNIDLPELGLHLPAILAGYPLISLGTITAHTARQLTAALLCDAP
jgi:hypothetical protein